MGILHDVSGEPPRLVLMRKSRMVQTWIDIHASDFENLTPEKEAVLMSQISAEWKGRAPKYEYLVPKNQESQQTSGLAVDVPAKGKTVCDFDLNDDETIKMQLAPHDCFAG
jgi:hypothetical protein